ncbi:serine hydrolase domain-containing protein [Parasphingorhabdus sp.]|uniref:serine hydrolase domain-containing protein n=1 Tax=Parasphingorhabdus sp. TaxID=2709688 RepID=UPI0035944A7B
MLKKLLSLGLIGTLSASPSFAQSDDAQRYDRALAAGYKAQFICSGLWNGGKSLADIDADELTGIYPRIADITPTLPAEVDQSQRQVRVSFGDDAPPRLAVWNSESGCTAMPIGFFGAESDLPDDAQIEPRQFLDDQRWPMGDLAAETQPADRSRALGALAERALDPASFGGQSSAVLVIRNGHIDAEKYKQGHDLHTAQRTWSVAKSMASTLIGHSVQQKMVDLHAPVQIPEWQKTGDPRAALTIDHLLRMSSGLVSDTAGNRTDPLYMGGASVSERATSWPLLYKPGARYRYANNDTLLAIHAARAQHLDRKFKLGNYIPAAHDFNPYGFFQKLGMSRTYVETDWQGNPILSSQVWTTARDLGRLGLLYLNNGTWNGERLLPENWRDYVTAPSGPQPAGKFGFGASFWLMNKSDGIPRDAFAGFGNRGQYLVIIPSLDLVIVRRGYDSADDRFDIEAFTREVVAAIAS